MLIDGELIAVPEQQATSARHQLGLPSDFFLVEATQQLGHDTGSGTVMIPLPADVFVVIFENDAGHRQYGAVRMDLK